MAAKKRRSPSKRKAPAKKKKLSIKKAIKNPGQLHRDLGVPQGKQIPVSRLRAAAKRKDKVGQRARFALTLRGLNKGGGGKRRAAPKRKRTRSKRR